MTRTGHHLPAAPGSYERGLRLALAPVLLLALTASCKNFPLRMYVDDEVFDELGRTSFADHVDDDAIAAGLRDAVGCAGVRAPLLGEEFHRVDVAPGVPFRLEDADDAAGAHLAGLATGDVILAKNFKAQSLATTLSFAEFTYYNHLGMLALEDGAAWVYEAWPHLDRKIITREFIERFRGGVRRTPLSGFLARYETLLFVRLPDEERNARAVAAARRTIGEDIPYDPYHDPNQPGLSCSEYLELLFVEEGYPDTLPDLAVGHNEALQRLSLSLGFTTPAYLVPDSFLDVPGARAVGTISLHRTPAEVRAMYEAFVFLHDRDRPDSPAGDYLDVDSWKFLVYRGTTLAFLEWTKGWIRKHPHATAEQRRALLEALYALCFRRAEE